VVLPPAARPAEVVDAVVIEPAPGPAVLPPVEIEGVAAFEGSHFRRRGRHPILAFVWHHSFTRTPGQTIRVLRRRGFSVHFEVDKPGAVYGYLDPVTAWAYHAGAGANRWSVGIETTHMPGAPWPEAQIDACVRLLVHLASLFPSVPLVIATDGVKRRGVREWAAEGFGQLRHRNLCATQCPDTFPLEEVVQRAIHALDAGSRAAS